jgi:hypothetical protein
MAARIGLGVIVAGAVAVGIAWGLGALTVYVFFVAISGLITLGATVGGDWLTGSSRGRFDEGKRRRS